jgi:hypothetical protein
VIRVGWLPSLARPSQQRKRTLPYRRVVRRRVRNVAPVASRVNDETMLFDQPPAELPVAVVMSKSRKTQVVTGISAWLVARWRWFRPRTVPMIVACVGLFAVVAFANYLKTYGRDEAGPERLTPPPVFEPVAEQQVTPPPAFEPVAEQQPERASALRTGCFKRHESLHQ